MQGNEVKMNHALCLPGIRKWKPNPLQKIKVGEILQLDIDRGLILVKKVSRFTTGKNTSK